MQLINILLGSETATEGILTLKIIADIGQGPEVMDYIYSPDDPYGLAPQIGNWLDSVSDFPISPYIPQSEPIPTLTRRQIRSALAINGYSRDAIPLAIESIEDQVERDLALIDWEDAPYYSRSHPLFNNTALIDFLDLTPEAIDAMWIAAKNLPE